MTAPRAYDPGLEGIRGVAAFCVGLSHTLALTIISAGRPLPPYLQTIEAGHAGVLIFFVLSGYVIGWTNQGAYSPGAAREYVRRRCVRLMPIYYIAAVLTLVAIAVSGYHEGGRVVAGFFLCLQNFNGYFGHPLNPPRVNQPLWSLNFEVLYYGLFLLLWRFKPRLAWVFLPAAALCTLGWFSGGMVPLFLSAYAGGWVFWAAGWWLTSLPKQDPDTPLNIPLLSMVLLVFANHQIDGLMRVFNALKLYCDDGGMIPITDLGTLPATMLVIAAASRRRIPYPRVLEAMAWAVCVVPIAGMVATGRLSQHAYWVTGAATVVLAALVRGYRSTAWLKPFAWFGGISYAFYVVHFPLLYLVAALPLPLDFVPGFLLRLAIWIAVTLPVSWVLEKRFQSWIKERLMGGAATPLKHG